jgi:hypothetical protein
MRPFSVEAKGLRGCVLVTKHHKKKRSDVKT